MQLVAYPSLLTSAAPKTFKLTVAFCLSVCGAVDMVGILVTLIVWIWLKSAMWVIWK